MAFELPKLPYEYNALEPFIDQTTMTLHHTKHHQAYIDKVNDAVKGDDKLNGMDISALLSKLEEITEDKAKIIRNNGGGHANHSLFWEIMAPKAGGVPEGEIIHGINDSFGNFDSFKASFTGSALGIFGSGWAWLIVKDEKLIITTTPNQDSPLMEGYIPILGLDVWEHAYYLKYQNRRPEYVEAWWNVVNWKEVDKRYKELISPGN